MQSEPSWIKIISMNIDNLHAKSKARINKLNGQL